MQPRAALAGAGAAAAAAVYCCKWRESIARPRLYAGQSQSLAEILQQLPALSQPYVPPVWCFSWWAQLGVHLVFEPLRPRPGINLRIEPLELSDGGVCGLAWAERLEGTASELPKDAPVLCIFHTVIGTPKSSMLRRLCGHALDRGFRPVVFLRRGHLGQPLQTAKFHLIGFSSDARLQIAAVQGRYPDAPLVALGISGGTGCLVRLGGEDAETTPLQAMACICPGYDTSTGNAFSKMWPAANRYMKPRLQHFFLDSTHADVLASAAERDPQVAASLRAARGAPTVEAFYEGLAGLAGFGSVEEMHAATNPMLTAQSIRVPGLIISALDDPVCTTAPEYIGHRLFDGGTEPRALVLLERGSHCAFYDGWSGSSVFSGGPTWAERLALDFLWAALAAAGLARGQEKV